MDRAAASPRHLRHCSRARRSNRTIAVTDEDLVFDSKHDAPSTHARNSLPSTKDDVKGCRELELPQIVRPDGKIGSVHGAPRNRTQNYHGGSQSPGEKHLRHLRSRNRRITKPAVPPETLLRHHRPTSYIICDYIAARTVRLLAPASRCYHRNYPC